MTFDYDVIVVGARCAGSSLAILLARRGLSVCVLDRASFPSDTLSTHVIQACGVESLARLGVREAVERTTTPMVRANLAFGDARGSVEDLPGLLGAPVLNVRRVTLDEILLEAAAAAGADVRSDTPVRDLLVGDGRVIGVRTAGGDLRARVVVGADGANSTVAELVGAREYACTSPQRIFAWAYLEGVARTETIDSTIWIGKPRGNGFLGAPTDGGLFMAATIVDLAHRHAFEADREAALRATFDDWPALADVVAQGHVQGPVRLVSRWHGFFRVSAGRGWALVGDAGHFKDPTPGQGISDALRQAEHLAASIAGAGTDQPSVDAALAEYWAWRDDDAWDMYWFAHDLGAAGTSPPLQAGIERHIASDPQHGKRLARVLNHESAPASLIPGPLAARIAATEMMHPRGTRREVMQEMARTARKGLQRRRDRSLARRRATSSPS